MIQSVAMSELKPHPMNPKQHAPEIIEHSIQSLGYLEPVIIDQRTGYLVAGHGRTETLRALKEAGEAPPAGISVKRGEWMVPAYTGWSSETDEQAHEAMITLNKATEMGGWQEESLLTLLETLQEPTATGFSEYEIELLRRQNHANEQMTVDHSQAADEFLDIAGVDGELIDLKYASVLRVYFQTDDARETFYQQLGANPNPTAKQLRYPLDWERDTTEEHV